MTFDEILERVIALLQHEGRVAYRVLKRRFDIDDEYVEDLKADLIDAKRLAVDEDGKVLVWIGPGLGSKAGKGRSGETEGEVVTSQLLVTSSSPPPVLQTPNAELRTHAPNL